jgi:hypothetical protein
MRIVVRGGNTKSPTLPKEWRTIRASAPKDELADASFLPTDYVSCATTNRFGFDLYPKEVRWAAAEGVSEDVIAAVLLLNT